DPSLGAAVRLAREAGRPRAGGRVRTLPPGRDVAAARGGGRERAPQGHARPYARDAVATRAPPARPPLRPRRRPPPHARRARTHVQRLAPAHPPDRDPKPE